MVLGIGAEDKTTLGCIHAGQGIHQSGARLHFFLPMGGGEHFWTAKIGVAGKAAYYCVSVTLLGLLHQILEKGQMHFPSLLEFKGVGLEISREALVHTPVPSHIAEKAYEKLKKEV